jgi:predicted Ser/Thr protein kinase
MALPRPSRIGDFEIVGVLGEGGSGIVYDARWGHREVALKVLHPALVATSKERDQFLAEARRLAEIHHAGVVKVLAVGEAEDGRPFLAMEKLHGGTLAARLGRGAVPVAQALELFGQLADAVGALHARGLVHRDLKPENVVLVAGPDGREHAVLLDFGIAKEIAGRASTTTQEGGIRGTPAYMAPERFFGQPASVATDVYELAVTLFAMLAGRLPWDDTGDPEVRLDPRRLGDLAPHVPAAVDLEVRRALSTRAQNRPGSASELRGAVMNAAGIQWTPRQTVDVKSGPIVLPPLPELGLAQTVDLHRTTGTAAPRVGKLVVIFGSVAVLATGIGIAAHYLSKPGNAIEAEAPAAAVPAPPVAAVTPPPAGERPAAAASSIIAATPPPQSNLEVALNLLPDDELFAFGVHLADLQRDSTLSPLIELFGKSTPGVMLRAEANLGACQFDIRGHTDWVIVGGPADDTAVDVIASGRWTRAEVEDCLRVAVAADTAEASGDRITILKGPRGDRTVGWLDERTFLLSSRDGADAAWMTERLDDQTLPTGKLGPLLGEIDLGSELWFAGDEAGGKRIALAEEGEMSGLWGALRSTPDEVTMDVFLRYPDPKLAATARTELETSVGSLGLDASMGHVTIEQRPDRDDVLHVDMTFSRVIAAILVEAVASKGLPE